MASEIPFQTKFSWFQVISTIEYIQNDFYTFILLDVFPHKGFTDRDEMSYNF